MQKKWVDEVLDVVFDARRKLISVYKVEGKEIMVEKGNNSLILWL